jgi:hypothetical protein
MGRKLIAASAYVVASLACVGASANTSASASMSMLEIQLIDLDPADGITPGVSFSTTSGTTASSNVSYSPTFYLYQYNNGVGAFGPVDAITAPPNGAVGASASVSGSPFAAGGLALVSSAFAIATGTTLGASGAFLTDGPYPEPFLLTPETSMVISAAGTTTATADQWPMYYEEASGKVLLQLAGSTGDGPQSSIAELLANVGPGYGPSSFDSASGELSVSFVNATASSSSGSFLGQSMSFVYTLAPAVPEPAGGTLLLLALGAFGLASMRRRPRA